MISLIYIFFLGKIDVDKLFDLYIEYIPRIQRVKDSL